MVYVWVWVYCKWKKQMQNLWNYYSSVVHHFFDASFAIFFYSIYILSVNVYNEVFCFLLFLYMDVNVYTTPRLLLQKYASLSDSNVQLNIFTKIKKKRKKIETKNEIVVVRLFLFFIYLFIFFSNSCISCLLCTVCLCIVQ